MKGRTRSDSLKFTACSPAPSKGLEGDQSADEDLMERRPSEFSSWLVIVVRDVSSSWSMSLLMLSYWTVSGVVWTRGMRSGPRSGSDRVDEGYKALLLRAASLLPEENG